MESPDDRTALTPLVDEQAVEWEPPQVTVIGSLSDLTEFPGGNQVFEPPDHQQS